jgi:hypothetical protein
VCIHDVMTNVVLGAPNTNEMHATHVP